MINLVHRFCKTAIYVVAMARPRKEPEGFAAGTLTFRLGDKHRAMLDEVLAKDPKQSRAAIVRAALEQYLERHPGAA